jgi:thiosulfate/3-mercaptopyruvate sulfurtransferase
MEHDTLINATELMALQAAGRPLVLLDCGFELTDPKAGQRAYAASHLPGAHYADLDQALAGPKDGSNGRHPLPTREALSQQAGRWGVAPGVQVVAYDDHGMPYAARAWWLLRWLGHRAVAVLDGGRGAWLAAGGTLNTSEPAIGAGPAYPASAAPGMPGITARELFARLSSVQDGSLKLLDARAAERFRGEVEPLDPIAGHIPGATLRFFKDNLAADGRFKPADQLRRDFEALGARGANSIQQCGSGVTACHNLLAMVHAGLGISSLFAGSWSEWCSDTSRPVARG